MWVFNNDPRVSEGCDAIHLKAGLCGKSEGEGSTIKFHCSYKIERFPG